ncbi:hypothetical protein GJ496_011006 [Pomphorhynchus laevis]|nr:hypothetical protein GJ496_008281 [Pomphorhynchus laevis]KAI0983312.1 hypothetical protein GJ496_011006 [Pomphorhynchus laevis]
MSNDEFRTVTMPLRFGGLGVIEPKLNPNRNYDDYIRICTHLLNGLNGIDLLEEQIKIRKQIRQDKDFFQEMIDKSQKTSTQN